MKAINNFLFRVPFYVIMYTQLFFFIINLFNKSNSGFNSDSLIFTKKSKAKDTNAYNFKFLYANMQLDTAFFILDYLTVFFFKKNIVSKNTQRLNYRLKQVTWQFYRDSFYSLKLNSYMYGLRCLLKSFGYWLVGIILFALAMYYLMYIRLLPFNKLVFEWILIIMFLYWLLSGFTFFIKKYQYSKFTSVIGRFWKRSYIIFWFAESAYFAVFFFLTLNASEEPTYMFDQAKLYKTHLFSWRLFFLKIMPVITLLIFSYCFLLNLKWNIFFKQSLVLLLLTLNLIYLVWLEFYQFFYVISFYSDYIWSFDYDDFLWNLDIEFRRTRIANNYVALCLIAKFWHLIFIFVFWVFFVLRVGELKRIRYTLFAANLSNFIILYIMSWLYMYPWLKFAFKRHYGTVYYWFFLNPRDLSIRLFFNDIKLFFFSFLSLTPSLNFFHNSIFFYMFESSDETNFFMYRKNALKDKFIVNTQL